MGTKKITDLQLIAAATADISIPGDNGIQTYRLTVQQLFDFILASQNITLPMLKNDIFTGLTAVTSADDDYFPFVDISDSNKTKKGLVGAFRNSPFRAVSSTDTATASDETLKLSGASFTQTLPANGTAGKRIRLVHSGTSLSQVYTLATQGGATIGGVASGSYGLYTNGEVLELMDDGTNWIVTYHRAVTEFVTHTPTLTNWGTSPSVIKAIWRRNGDCFEGQYDIQVGTSPSGVTQVELPTGMLSDNSGKLHSGTWMLVGYAVQNGQGTPHHPIILGNQTAFSFGFNSAGGTALTQQQITLSGQVISVFVKIPIDGWRA